MSGILRNPHPGQRPHRDVPPNSKLRKSYDLVIGDGSDHGPASAHYLSNVYGITSVGVLNKSYLAGGNTARNTTTIRSNYLTQAAISFCMDGVSLFETMSRDHGFNVMFSQRGQLTLARTAVTLRNFHLRAEQRKQYGIGIEVIGPRTVRDHRPYLNMDQRSQN